MTSGVFIAIIFQKSGLRLTSSPWDSESNAVYIKSNFNLYLVNSHTPRRSTLSPPVCPPVCLC